MEFCHGTSVKFLLIFVFIFLNSLLDVIRAEACIKSGNDPCVCSNSKGTIDLRPIEGKLIPIWKDVPSSKTSDYKYSYSPCTPFAEPEKSFGGCSGVLACQVFGETGYYPLAKPNTFSVEGDVDKDNLVFHYNASESSIDRSLSVQLHCAEDEVPRFEAFGEEQPLSTKYIFMLYSRWACYDGVYRRHAGVSAGTILCILFFLGLLIYALGGFLFLTYVRHAQGAERCPNVDFWRDFPFLVRDGVLFVVRGCKLETSYDRI